MFPANIIALISEYSKPLTRPDWRKGSPHSKLLKYSQPFTTLTNMLINIKDYYKYDYNKLFDALFIHTLLKSSFDILLQKYGDKVFDLFKSYKPNQMNFYRWCRLSCYMNIVENTHIDIPTKMEYI